MNNPRTRTQCAFQKACLLGAFFLGFSLGACNDLISPNLPTALPADYIPTAVSLTLTASGFKPPAPLGTLSATSIHSKESQTTTPLAVLMTQTNPTLNTSTAADETAITPTIVSAITSATTAAPLQTTPTIKIPFLTSETPTHQETILTDEKTPAAVTNTPAPPIPDARIQIYRLGDLSKVVSPIDVSLRLTCGEAKVVRVALLGEDGRLLARYVREYNSQPWEAARIGLSMDFEINAAAELGRLIVSAEDTYNRLIEINSMNLILLSQGTTELNPSSGLQQQIIIQEPAEKSLIQNGSLIVSGRARTESEEPLRVMLFSEEGKVLGQRLAAVTANTPGDYGQFIAELPYDVKEITPALLVVYEEGAPSFTIIRLTSLNVVLVPR